MLITRTSLQNRAVLEAFERKQEVSALVVKRDVLQKQFDTIFSQDVEKLTGEMIAKGRNLMAQIATMNKAIGVKSSKRQIK